LNQFAFEQSCYHGSFILIPQEFVLWFYQTSAVFLQTGEYALLLPLLEKYLPLAEKTIESSPGETAYYYSCLAKCYSAAGDYHQAERMAAEALDIRQNNLGPLDTGILDSLKQLGWIYQNQNRSIESLFFFKQVFNKCTEKTTV